MAPPYFTKLILNRLRYFLGILIIWFPQNFIITCISYKTPNFHTYLTQLSLKYRHFVGTLYQFAVWNLESAHHQSAVHFFTSAGTDAPALMHWTPIPVSDDTKSVNIHSHTFDPVTAWRVEMNWLQQLSFSLRATLAQRFHNLSPSSDSKLCFRNKTNKPSIAKPVFYIAWISK